MCELALAFFAAARTQINQGLIEEGMVLLEQALDCKWVAVEAAKVLHQVNQARLESQPDDMPALLAEGALLTKMEQLEQACNMFNLAAAAFRVRAAPRLVLPCVVRSCVNPSCTAAAGTDGRGQEGCRAMRLQRCAYEYSCAVAARWRPRKVLT